MQQQNQPVLNRINRCSFCESNNHNIKRCNDPLLKRFEENLLNKKNMLLEILSISLSDKITYFKIWINNQPVNIIKSYAMRFCGAKSKNNVSIFVESIINHIWNAVQPVNVQTESVDSVILVETIFIQNSYSYLELELSEFLARLRNDYVQINESKKFNIEIILSIEINNANLKEKENCNICYEETEETDMVVLNCDHKFCGTCVKQILKKCKPNCALCRQKIVCMTIKNEELVDNLKENIV
jgi:hypothetical protein